MRKTIINDYIERLNKSKIIIPSEIHKKIPHKYSLMIQDGNKSEEKLMTYEEKCEFIKNKIKTELEKPNKNEFTVEAIIKTVKKLEKLENLIENLNEIPYYYNERLTVEYNNKSDLIFSLFCLLKYSKLFYFRNELLQLSDEFIFNICPYFHIKFLEKDEVLLKIHEKIESFFIVIKGSVAVQSGYFSNDCSVQVNQGGIINIQYFPFKPRIESEFNLISQEKTILLELSYEKIMNFNVNSLYLSSFRFNIEKSLRSSLIISNKAYKLIYKKSIYLKLNQNQILFNQNGKSYFLAYLLSGELNIIHKKKGQSYHLMTIKSNSILGSESLDNLNNVDEDLKEDDISKERSMNIGKYKYSIISTKSSEVLLINYYSLKEIKKEIVRVVNEFDKKTEEFILSNKKMNDNKDVIRKINNTNYKNHIDHIGKIENKQRNVYNSSRKVSQSQNYSSNKDVEIDIEAETSSVNSENPIHDQKSRNSLKVSENQDKEMRKKIDKRQKNKDDIIYKKYNILNISSIVNKNYLLNEEHLFKKQRRIQKNKKNNSQSKSSLLISGNIKEELISNRPNKVYSINNSFISSNIKILLSNNKKYGDILNSGRYALPPIYSHCNDNQ